MLLQQIKPRNARSKRALEKREPQLIELPKSTLFLRGTSCSQIVQLALTDIYSLKRPLAVKFNKKNPIHPFEDVSSLEFFAEKNDAPLMVFGHHSKKRPHGLTIIRCFSNKVLDMLELHIDAESFRTLNQFKNKKASVGLKPMLAFSGTLFESANSNSYTLAKSLFIDLFRGPEVANVDVEGLQYMIHFTAREMVDGEAPPQIQMRVYLIKTKKSGHKLPRVEVEEMGPRIDFRIGRSREPDSAALKESLKKPKQFEPKTKKNVETDLIGDKVGRIHVGQQNLHKIQTRKMKGLKRGREENDVNGNNHDDEAADDDDDAEADITVGENAVEAEEDSNLSPVKRGRTE